MAKFEGNFNYHFKGHKVEDVQELVKLILSSDDELEMKLVGSDVFYTVLSRVEEAPIAETEKVQSEVFCSEWLKMFGDCPSTTSTNHALWDEVMEGYTTPVKLPHSSPAGVKHNQGKLPINTMITVQFPKAIKAIAQTTLFGHEKYKEVDKDWLNFKRVEGGSQTYADASQRHGFDKHTLDSESGLPHIFHKAWNALAELEIWIEENNL